MTDDNGKQDRQISDAQRDKREQRAMWIFSGAIVLLILVAMGANVLFHHDSGSATDISSQSRTTPER
jgi:hypothetical protein